MTPKSGIKEYLKGELMPNSTQTFSINACIVTPDGNAAQMSRSDSNDQPNQGKWTNDDSQYDYTITLPDDAWALAEDQPDCSASLTFTVTPGNTSCIYQLLPDAPTGLTSYTLQRSDGTTCKEPGVDGGDPQDPDVIINT
jgi:hypothetical protein